MAPIHMICTVLLAATTLTSNAAAMAMVLDAPRPRIVPNAIGTSPLAPPPASRPATTRKQFRIRRTRVSDLDAISSMLAGESVPSSGTPNWNDGVRRLRAKSLLEKQLSHRLAAIEEGRKTMERMKLQFANMGELCSLSDDDTCHLLWTNDNFRSKLRNAVANSQETSAWLEHSFDLTPTPEMLNHVMMTVEETSSGDIAGFSEVAWLPTPTTTYDVDGDMLQMNYDEEQRMQVFDVSLDVPDSNYCEETSDSYCDAYDFHDDAQMQCAPAIVNLVTSPSYRRMGIAGRVLHFASKYTKTQWLCRKKQSLGLYVHRENESALRLYSNQGFSVVPSECEDDLLYMTQRR